MNLHCIIVPLLTLGTWGCILPMPMYPVEYRQPPPQQQSIYEQEMMLREDMELEMQIDNARRRQQQRR
jgi:hypothetical protein